MEPTTVTCASSCTVTHVITVDIPPLNLSAADGGAVAGAILAVWAVGFAFRALIQTLRGTDRASGDEE